MGGKNRKLTVRFKFFDNCPRTGNYSGYISDRIV